MWNIFGILNSYATEFLPHSCFRKTKPTNTKSKTRKINFPSTENEKMWHQLYLFLQNKAFFKLYLFWLWKCCNNKKFMCMSNIETFCHNWWRFYLGSVHDASILCHAIEDGLPGNRNRLIKIFWHNSASGSTMGLK